MCIILDNSARAPCTDYPFSQTMSAEPAISLETFLSDVPRLSSFAGVVGKLESVMRDSSSSLQEVAEMVGQDQSLTARLLRLANRRHAPHRLNGLKPRITA